MPSDGDNIGADVNFSKEDKLLLFSSSESFTLVLEGDNQQWLGKPW